jgi:hypothetical protein
MNGIVTAVVGLIGLLLLDVGSIVQGVGLLAMIITGPVLLAVYMGYLSKSHATDFRAFAPEHRLATFGTLSATVISTIVTGLYLVNHPSLILS